MRVPVSWLREYVSFDLPPRELGERLSMNVAVIGVCRQMFPDFSRKPSTVR